MNKTKNIKGRRFGHLKVIRKSSTMLYKRGACWDCRCDCGRVVVCWGSRLRAGKQTHCGCLTSEIISAGKTVHAFSKKQPRLYRIWKMIIQRCTNPNCDAYPKYGAIGITICDEWRESPEQFVIWALSHGYQSNLTIDRYPNRAGNYEPSNCRWATPKQQANNRNDNRLITWKGETKTVSEWSDTTGINYHTISKRILKWGWSVEEALTLEPSKDAWRRGVRVA